ncbi:hypothetical protein GYMLUDRAFT_47048 [Collybiopsis luxurians FD-317 M1]|uniref:Uncharacterized protein n=1 Tax=Collybiopsis luxurians FD-317 M1 TaxID=944289 RepID=A0A0D0C2N2_9AGAR|nr:hypothetical protein GYMLUDRAFT_47048 [Collybiopsis luxurians FD-317 M1]
MASSLSPIVLGEDGEGVMPKKNADVGVGVGANANAGWLRAGEAERPTVFLKLNPISISISHLKSSGDELDETFEAAAGDALIVFTFMSPPHSDKKKRTMRTMMDTVLTIDGWNRMEGEMRAWTRDARVREYGGGGGGGENGEDVGDADGQGKDEREGEKAEDGVYPRRSWSTLSLFCMRSGMRDLPGFRGRGLGCWRGWGGRQS